MPRIRSIANSYSQSADGQIEIKPRSLDDDKRAVIIKDNGVGFANDLDFRNTSSLGPRFVNSLTNQLKGGIELDLDVGTQFKIRFPALRYKERM